MKAKTAAQAKRLEHIPNIGKSIANDLRKIGISAPHDLKGKEGIKLYLTLNKVMGVRHDPCVLDTFLAAVDFMNGGTAKPWYSFTARRKKLFKNI